jgi:hypothetical protein
VLLARDTRPVLLALTVIRHFHVAVLVQSAFLSIGGQLGVSHMIQTIFDWVQNIYDSPGVIEIFNCEYVKNLISIKVIG